MTESDSSGRCFVLVHGGFQGGWCYARVADILRERGHRVYTPTLTGLGERSHLTGDLINCSTHVLDVINVIRWEQLHDVILCGHSYGGMVIAGVADALPEHIASLIYLDAIIPRDGISLSEMRDLAEAMERAISAGTGPNKWLPPVPAAVFNLIDPADERMVDTLSTPHPLATFTERMRLTGAYMQIAKKTYVKATAWASSLPSNIYDWTRHDNSWTYCEMACGHQIMLDSPMDLADLLVGAS